MSRYLLDTNILIFYILGQEDNFTVDTTTILTDYNNQIYTSSISIMEMVQLFNIGKIKSKKFKLTIDLVDAVENFLGVKILPFAKQHAQTLAQLKIADAHNDPFDHSIISHAITDKLILVSSDKKFKDYTKQNLNFVFNKR